MHQHGRSTNPTSQPLPLPASGRTVYRGIPRHPAGRCHGSGAGAARFPLAEASGLRRVLVGPHFPSRSRSCGLCGSNRSPSVRARFPRRAPPHSGCGRKRGGFAYERCLRQLLGPCDASRGFRAICLHGRGRGLRRSRRGKPRFQKQPLSASRVEGLSRDRLKAFPCLHEHYTK